MQLRTARLCLDCDEVHDLQQCPSCASETFAFMTRWVPVPDRPQKRVQPPEVQSPEALSAYRDMLQPGQNPGGTWRTVRRGALGLAIFGIAGWLWRQNSQKTTDPETTQDAPGRQRS